MKFITSLKHRLFISTLAILSPLIAMQSAKAGEQDTATIVSAFEHLGVSTQTVMDNRNQPLVCGTCAMDGVGPKFANRTQIVCVGEDNGAYRVRSTVYRHSGENAFPEDIALKMLKLAANVKFGEFSITPARRNKIQFVSVAMELQQPEAKIALPEAITAIAVTADRAEKEIIGTDRW